MNIYIFKIAGNRIAGVFSIEGNREDGVFGSDFEVKEPKRCYFAEVPVVRNTKASYLPQNLTVVRFLYKRHIVSQANK